MTLPLLDVRDEGSFAAGHAADAVNIPSQQLLSRMYELPEKGSALQVFHDRIPDLERAIALLRERGYDATAADGADLSQRGPSAGCLWRPSPLLAEFVPASPGRAADLACGSGREAVYLARLGWQIDAVDILPDALERAQALASRNGVVIRTVRHDLTGGIPLGRGQYDLVTMFRYLQRPLTEAVELLRPGGVLIVETFHVSDAGDGSRDRSRLIADGELARLVEPLCQVVVMRDGVVRNGRHYSQLVAHRR
jgi:tellurite methyltransferase